MEKLQSFIVKEFEIYLLYR